ncbi:MAG TPA: sigma-54 dependent transcriptional regulator [Terracidiphilus sp.]|nr:sigma-54 dependent transcriptional regulator [Terracidiphilus sp.]
MQTATLPVPPASTRVRPRSAVVASADSSFRQRVCEVLSGLRWQVRQAGSGAQAWAHAESAAPEALIVDAWLPDLDQNEFLNDFRSFFPDVDLVTANGDSSRESPRGPHRQELLYALRRCQDTDASAWQSAPELGETGAEAQPDRPCAFEARPAADKGPDALEAKNKLKLVECSRFAEPRAQQKEIVQGLPELIGNAGCMLEISRRVRLVAPRTTPVLIEGPTGSGKELVARAVHRLSQRSRKPFVAINCAAIPEALLEAELFGHTRGAFTGAVQGRVGRIESADGGTLFLDEIGEMPLALQSKLLRFVESGELQRVGDNQTVKVDVRLVAATHQPLAENAQSGIFRPDLYYRLAVFLIRTPSLGEHLDDLPLLVEHFLGILGREAPLKKVDAAALRKLSTHSWPGNVRELQHVLERAAILAGDAPMLTSQEIDFGMPVN